MSTHSLAGRGRVAPAGPIRALVWLAKAAPLVESGFARVGREPERVEIK